MTTVFGVPPGVAHADSACEKARKAIVCWSAEEDLSVRCLVREECDLREYDAERAGYEELEPALPQEHESGDRAAEGDSDGEPN